MYEAIRFRGKTTGIRRLSDGACIPISMDNRDYVEFSKWQNEQSEENKLDVSDKEPPAKKYDEKRREAYESQGLTTNELIIALWEDAVEGRPEKMQEIQTKRESIKNQFPKD